MEQRLHPQPDQATVQRLKQGHRATFEGVFRQYYPGLCYYAQKYLSDPEIAEEIVQNLFYKLWERRETLEIRGAIKAYLYNATRNNCLSHLRHEKVKTAYQEHVTHTYEEAEDSLVDAMQEAELRQFIFSTIEQLPAQCRKIFQLSRFEELSYKEIAQQLELSPKTVEAQMGKALKRLREALDHYRLVGWLLLWLIHELLERWPDPGFYA